MPRQDKRKEALKEQVESCLILSTNFQEFEQNMRRRGYEVRKGKGISFFDGKAVKVKGCELGYPLWKVEKLLEDQVRKREQLLSQGPVQQRKAQKQVPQQEKRPSRHFKL